MRRVVCAAIECDGEIIAGARHYDRVMCDQIRSRLIDYPRKARQGFIDQRGVFMDREEALAVAQAANQIIREKNYPLDKLFSEDLY